MLALALSLLATVSLQLQAPTDLPPAELAELQRLLGRALDAHPTARTKNGEQIRLVVDVGATRLQVLAERVDGGAVVARAAEVGPRAVADWYPSAAKLVDALYGPPPTEPNTVRNPAVVAPSERPARPAPWGSWALLGTGAAALAVGVVFAVSSADASASLDRPLVVDPELSELESRVSTHGALSAAMAATALGCALAGVILMRADE